MSPAYLRGYLQLNDDVNEVAEDSEDHEEDSTEESSDSDDEWTYKTFIFHSDL